MLKLRIGICDDEKLVIDGLERMIAECLCAIGQDYEIHTFLSGSGLIKKVQELDVVFLDVIMPDMDGYETGKKINKLNPGCRIIMATGETEHFEEAFKINAVWYLKKPFNKEGIKDALTKVINLSLGMSGIELYKERNKYYVLQKNIKYVRAYNGYTEYFVGKEIFRQEMSLKGVERELDKRLFFRIDKTYIVNFLWIDACEDGKIWVEGNDFLLSRRRKNKFYEAYLQYQSEYT
ncbi:MAG: response regulator transcription factor [Clostridiales bacterium]|nr:response regulator transcription factor [Clostridiales bacterium]